MIGKYLWERYLIKETLKTFFLFLFSFYFLYLLIDYSMHLQQIMKSEKLKIKELMLYYFMLFSKRLTLLLPLALLISSLKVLTSMNRKNELLALESGGIGIKSLMRPFFFIALLCVGINYFNSEMLSSRSLIFINLFEKKFFKSKKKPYNNKESMHILVLEDGSRLIYQDYDQENRLLLDLFYVLSTDEIYTMKTLSLKEGLCIGNKVDRLNRNENGFIEKKDSFDTFLFSSLTIDPTFKDTLERPLENRSIQDLISLLRKKRKPTSAIQSHLLFKLLMPLLPLFVMIGIIPYTIVFKLSSSPFILFAIAIFGYIAFFSVLKACLILSQAQVVSPFWAFLTPTFLFLFFFGRKFLNTKSMK